MFACCRSEKQIMNKMQIKYYKEYSPLQHWFVKHQYHLHDYLKAPMNPENIFMYELATTRNIRNNQFRI